MSSSSLQFFLPKPPVNASSPSQSQWSGLYKLQWPLPCRNQTLTINPNKPPFTSYSHLKSLPLTALCHHPLLIRRPSTTAVSAGRSKKKPGNTSPGRIEGSGEVRRAAKENARRRSRRISENRFFRRSRAAAEQADSFTEDELEMIGLGYDRAVRFMAKDDPLLRHPHDWYKYGRYGPYSWRGIVVGPPVRGRFTDERVALLSEVNSHEEFEQIEQFEMANDFSRHLKDLDRSSGLRRYWVFVRHPKWIPSELPWQQWTLVSEVAIEASRKERIDKWSLMGRLGNKSRADITQCAAWMRPDIIYVKKPLYQCRFEPQDEFFKKLWPLLDPSTENQFKFELRREENGKIFVENCTYFGGLCKILKVSPKSYVDDVVNAYQKLTDEGKSRCLEFLLRNHPAELLHPYTKEWKAKLEEMELGCDAPDESDDDDGVGETGITSWVEGDEQGFEDDGEDEDDDYVIEAVDGEDDGMIDEEDDDNEDENRDAGGRGKATVDPEETEEYWDQQWQKALNSSQAMEELVKKRLDASDKVYKQQMEEEEERKRERQSCEANQTDVDAELEQMKAEWKREEFKWARRKVKKSKLSPEVFLKSAVRPFTYRNLVKEVVLMRHAILDGDIGFKR